MKKLIITTVFIAAMATAAWANNMFLLGVGGQQDAAEITYERLYDSGAVSLEDSSGEALYSTEVN